MTKRLALLLTMPLWLLGCASVPTVRVMEVCPKPPALELDVPARDYLALMRDFLQGSLPMPPDYRLDSTPAKLPTIR